MPNKIFPCVLRAKKVKSADTQVKNCPLPHQWPAHRHACTAVPANALRRSGRPLLPGRRRPHRGAAGRPPRPCPLPGRRAARGRGVAGGPTGPTAAQGPVVLLDSPCVDVEEGPETC